MEFIFDFRNIVYARSDPDKFEPMYVFGNSRILIL